MAEMVETIPLLMFVGEEVRNVGLAKVSVSNYEVVSAALHRPYVALSTELDICLNRYRRSLPNKK